jgi:hypothetical protein
MDFLKGLVWVESCGGLETWCFAVEDPKNSSQSIVFKCKSKEIQERGYSKKRSGMFKFKAFRFIGKIEKKEVIKKPILKIISDLSEDCFQDIPLTELKKLKEWTD